MHWKPTGKLQIEAQMGRNKIRNRFCLAETEIGSALKTVEEWEVEGEEGEVSNENRFVDRNGFYWRRCYRFRSCLTAPSSDTLHN